MEKSKYQRVVPSGKVYRQIFDAEVQLVKALEQTDQKIQEKAGQKENAFGIPKKEGIPVVQNVDEDKPHGGMLSSRQKTWTEAHPNEHKIENPILYKFYSEELHEQRTMPESARASQEVQGLPDVLEPAKPVSDIIERISESKRLRHDAAIEDMHQELGVISTELEPRIVEAGESLISFLTKNDEDMNKIMAQIESDEDLEGSQIDDLSALWQQIAKQSEIRQHKIKELDVMLADIENDRMCQVKSVFQAYAKSLENIAHLLPADLHRLLDAESQLINQTVLSNRRAYADLYARLMMSDIERERRLHIQWKKRVDDWKTIHVNGAVGKFQIYMQSEEVMNSPNVKKTMEMMLKDQEILNQKRWKLIMSLKDMKPPTATKSSVYKWHEQLTEVSKQIDEANQTYFNQLYREYETICQKCLEEVEKLKVSLVENGVSSEEYAQIVIKDRCLPLVGSTQAMFENKLEKMDKELEEHNTKLLMEFKMLFKYCQGAAHVWDGHELGLAKQERALQEKLEECRRKHDNENQDREANLDIIMDRMRQDATENSLKTSLTKAIDMLEKIKEGYNKFHGDQSKIVDTYPNMVQRELNKYDNNVCRFFTVGRTHPEKARRDAEQAKIEAAASKTSQRSTGTESGGKSTPRNQKRTPRMGSRHGSRHGSVAASRSNSRTSMSDEEFGEKPTSPIPLAVAEVLSTSKGTTFYVLTVAGEYGAPPEDDKSTGSSKGTSKEAFLTEAPSAPETVVDERPQYIKNVDIPDSILMEVKRLIRMNFLDHLDQWFDQGMERARSVVSAKMEELNSELDLRLHLHVPRNRRAELDVHNVRAAELVMHSERVQRHCKGVNQILNDLKQRFQQMTQEHNKLTTKFRSDIEALEIVFVNATKSAKLVALSTQLQVEQDKYMEVIRTSLRGFRQHLDDTLQMLRESNAKFIKSFKVFSDGGNFCPEEIDDYKKRLEKMAAKIDTSEGFIMADLEGMESKRLDLAMKISREFEDRFKHHMIDLLFMEKIARWLTNTQVKIKAEVADSNSQAQTLNRCLDDLERRIDACLRPNLDKESVTPTQLKESLNSLFEAFHERSRYLNCTAEARLRPLSGSQSGNPAVGTRVNFLSGEVVPQISRAGKQPIDDPTVGVIKSILKSQRNRLKGGDGELELENATQSDKDARDKASRMPSENKPQTGNHKGRKDSKPGTANNSVADVPPANSRRNTSGKNKGIDKKYYVFGETPEEGELDHLLGRTKRVLREALDGLLAAAEIYYRQKGNRFVTRPQALQETFEQCADVVVNKTQSYYKQTDDYHNQCLQEMRGQLTRLEQLVAQVPSCVIQELVNSSIKEASQKRSAMDGEFSQQLTTLDGMKLEHSELLRPSLGHPAQQDALAQLCLKESERRQQYLDGVTEHTKAQQQLAVNQGKQFIDDLAKESEQLLIMFDNLLCVDDVDKGRVPTVKHPTSELIRRTQAGDPLEDDDEKGKLPRGRATWPGLSKTELSAPGIEPEPPAQAPAQAPAKPKRGKSKSKKVEEPSNLTASVNTAKTTLGHSATIVARDAAYQEYKKHFEATLALIAAQQEKHEIAEQRWTNSWSTNVDKVKALY